MSVYFFAWAASIIYGLEFIGEKLISKHSVKNPWLFNFVLQTFIFLGTATIALSMGVKIPIYWQNILWASLFYALSHILYFITLYWFDVSVMSPLFNIRTVMTVLLGTFFLGEILSVEQYILIAIIFIFGIFVNMDEKLNIKSFFSWKITLVLVEMLFLTLVAFFIKKAIGETDYWSATLWIALIAQIWFLFTIPLFKKDIPEVSGRQYSEIGVVSILAMVGILAANAAYAQNISIATAIIALPLSMVIAFMFAQFAPELLEKHTLKVYLIRFVSTAVMILAALNL